MMHRLEKKQSVIDPQLWPNWAKVDLFDQLTYEPIYLNELRTEAKSIFNRLEKADYSADIMRDIAPFKSRLDDYMRGHVLVDICHRLDPEDIFWQQEQQRYVRDRRLLNDLMAQVHELIFRKTHILQDLVNEAGKMPLILAHNQTAINRDYVTLQQHEEDELVSDVQHMSVGYQDYPAALETILKFSPKDEAVVTDMVDELVAVRSDLAQEQGFDSFVELGYRRLGYFDVQPKAVLRMHQEIESYVVPVATQIRQALKQQGYCCQTLFEASLAPFTGRCLPFDVDGWILPFNRALKISLGKHAPNFWLTLADRHYIQIHERLDNRSRFKCHQLTNPNIPILYANRGLSAQTLSSYLNIAGRAFGQLCSQTQKSRFFTIEPSMMAVRLWGKMMEGLGHLGIETLFATDEEGHIWQKEHLASIVLELPLLTLLNDFQMQIHLRPNISHQERDYLWLKLICRYFPDLAKDRQWLSAQSRLWLHCLSTYTEPFSALSKMVADFVGLSIWDMAKTRRKEALNAYATFCTMVNDDTTLRILKQSRIPSPFDPGCIKRLIYQLTHAIEV